MSRATTMVLMLLLLPPTTAMADTWTVDPSGSGDYTAIQDAIHASVSGDRIEVAPGTYTEALVFCGREVEVVGTGGAGVTTITPPAGLSAVSFIHGEGPAALLSGFTISGADVRDMELAEGEDPPGAGVQITYSCPTLTDLVIEDNAAIFGGGVKIKYNAHPLLERVTIRDNVARDCGGGLYLCQSDPTLIDVQILENVAEIQNGGGVILGKNSSPRFHRVLIAGNAAGFDGGGIYVLGVQPGEEVDALLTNVTVASNICDLLGKGGHGANVYLHLAIDATFVNTIVSNGLLGEGIYVLDFDPLVPDALAISYSDFWGNAAGDVVSADHGELLDSLPVTGLLRADPLFVDPGADDFRLQTVADGFEADSPCVDVGYPGEGWDDPDGSPGDLGAYGGPESMNHDTSACDGPGDGDPCAGDDDDAADDDDLADDDSATEYKTCVCAAAATPAAPAGLLLLGALLLQRRKSR